MSKDGSEGMGFPNYGNSTGNSAGLKAVETSQKGRLFLLCSS